MSEDDDTLAEALRDAGQTVPQIKEDKLSLISKLANRQLRLQAEVELVEEQLTKLQDELKVVSEKDLPNAMMDAGFRNFTLKDGSSIKIEKYLSVNLPTIPNRPKAYNWLVDNGYGGIVKTLVNIEFGKGNEERAEASKFAEELRDDGYDASLKEEVNVQTLKATIAEQLSKKVIFPEIFPQWHGDRAKITTIADAQAKRRASDGE